ncbi:MAG: hypothetical protein NPIRA02_07040 [Nitrospirales bacterium]|nr:MAG: hypothetical protein NPIRA02_07040 [Nitrospirales bacterium]
MKLQALWVRKNRICSGMLVALVLCIGLLAFNIPAFAQTPDPDLNNDGTVDSVDGSIVGSCFGADFSENPQCTCADTDGNKVIDLTDVNFVKDALGRSGFPVGPNACVISNDVPVADAGRDQKFSAGDMIKLDGSGSSDPDSDPLTFLWRITSEPSGSAAVLDDPTAVMPTFLANVPGTYIVKLVVNDGKENSAPDTVIISTDNLPPVADAGPDQLVMVGDSVKLDGRNSSDPDDDSITFQWQLTSVPVGSTATLLDGTGTMPTFLADLPGVYVARLIVNDGTFNGEPDEVVITAIDDGVLTCGDLLSGSIDEAGEVDTFTFTGQENQVVAVTITGTQMAAKVFGPSGSPIIGFFSRTQRVVTLPENGTYVIEVVGSSFVATGDYSLGLECLAPPSPDAVALSCGSLAPGNIAAASEADLFTFSGTAGQVVAVTITGTQMAAKVFGPSGSPIIGFFSRTQRVVTLPENGTYVIEVVGSSFVATGDYSLELECP